MSGDPRDWTPERRASYLEERGLPITRVETRSSAWSEHTYEVEFSCHRGVEIEWTSTLDDRIIVVVEEILATKRPRPVRAWAHKGGCGFWWRTMPPPEYECRQTVDVVIDGEFNDCWTIGECIVYDPLERTWRDYAELLREMPYPDYLAGKHWLALREEAWRYYGRSCVLCGSTERLEVHHRSYRNRGSETMADLIVLCHRCHARHHGRAA